MYIPLKCTGIFIMQILMTSLTRNVCIMHLLVCIITMELEFTTTITIQHNDAGDLIRQLDNYSESVYDGADINQTNESECGTLHATLFENKTS